MRVGSATDLRASLAEGSGRRQFIANGAVAAGAAVCVHRERTAVADPNEAAAVFSLAQDAWQLTEVTGDTSAGKRAPGATRNQRVHRDTVASVCFTSQRVPTAFSATLPHSSGDGWIAAVMPWCKC